MFARNRGFSLIEIMVGLVVGLVCMIVIYQAYSSFEDQKRTTTAGGDAQTNGSLALFLMEREIRAAGNGMTEGEPQNYPPLAGCLTNVYDQNGAFLAPQVTKSGSGADATSKKIAAGTETAIRFAPAIVTDGGDKGQPDSATVVYGTSLIAAPYTVVNDYDPGDGTINLNSTVGIRVGDMVALIQSDPDIPDNVGNYIVPSRCVLLQVTAIPSEYVIAVAPGTRYNKAGGTVSQPIFKADKADAKLFNLGQLNIATFRIANNNLVADSAKFGVTPNGAAGVPVVNRTDFSPLVSGIVNMQIQYGVDTESPPTAGENCNLNKEGSVTPNDSDGMIDQWVDATKTWDNDGAGTPNLFDMRRVRAVRIGLVARSAIKEVPKPDDPRYPDYPNCSTTTEPVVIHWENDNSTKPSGSDMYPDLSIDKEWKCYRYKVYQVTVPIRNAIWSSTMNPASAANCGRRGM